MRGQRGGYTLLELLLVLTVLVAATAVVWPNVERLHDRHQLQQAVEDVRVQLARARLQAIETGTTYRFDYEPAGRSYQMGPSEINVAENQSMAGNGQSSTVTGQLPEALQFVDVEGQTVLSDSMNEVSRTLPVSGTLADETAGRASSILFRPDGSATDAAFGVIDSENRSIRLSVRGLTGAVKVGTVERRAER